MMKRLNLFSIGIISFAALTLSATESNRGLETNSSELKVVSEWQNGVPTANQNVVKRSSSPAKAPSLKNLRINGFMMYDNNRSEDVKGFYEYSVTAPISNRPLVYVARQYVGGDAVVKDGKLYSCHVDESYGYVNSAFYTVIDVETGTATKSPNISYDLSVAMEHAATSAAVNPVNGETYCSGYTYNEDKTLTPTLKIWDLQGNKKTSIGKMEAMLAVMAFDKNGKLYGITACSSKGSDDGGRLVSVDTATGKLSLIGDTGIRPWFDQSGVISPYDGILYWFVNEPIAGSDANAAKAELYTVDLNTAKATSIGALPNDDEVVAAWIPTQTIADAAPGVISGLSATFEKGSLSGTVSFTLPKETYSGTELSGEISWKLSSGGKEIASGRNEAGREVTAPVSVEKSGDYTFSVVPSNTSGNGIVSDLNIYVGYGVPNAPKNVIFSIEGEQNVITWTHSDGLVGKGYIEGNPSYKIVRQPGNVVLEEKFNGNSYKETALSGALQSTFYEITPVNGDVSGSTAKSNALVTGSSLELPYKEDFTEASSFDLYTAIDVNNDKSTWYYSVKSAKIRQTTSGNQNDWLVLPPVTFEKGKSYEFKFNCYATQQTNVNILDVAMGLTAADMNITLLKDIEVKDTKSTAMKEISVVIKPNETATYRLGILIKSAARQGTFTVDDISISAGQSTAVPAAPEVKVIAGEKGALSTKLFLTLPTKTAGGETLSNRPISFEIERDGKALPSVDVNANDTEYTVTDSTIEKDGKYTYAVRAVNADGKGEISEASVYVGVDTPLAPKGFIAKDNFDGTVTLSWDEASQSGMNDGYVRTDNIRYTITNPDGTKTTGVTGTSKVVDHEITGVQKEVNFKLAVHYADVEPLASHTVTSNTLIAGAAYKDSFAETFPVNDGVVTPSTAVWTKELVDGRSSQFSMAMRTDDHTGDGSGCLHFTGYAADASGRWISPVIDLSKVQSPEVTMWVKTADANSTFELQISKEYGDWITVSTPENINDWTEVKASLANYRSKHIRLGMFVRSKSNMNFTYIDDIKVQNTQGSGVSEIASDSDIEEYYTLQGIKVNGKPSPGIYIVRKGSETKKVLVR